MRQFKHYTLDKNGNQIIQTKEFQELNEEIEITPSVQMEDTEAIIMETLLDQEIRISALELGA